MQQDPNGRILQRVSFPSAFFSLRCSRSERLRNRVASLFYSSVSSKNVTGLRCIFFSFFMYIFNFVLGRSARREAGHFLGGWQVLSIFG